jgi:hypothetical protein
MKKEQVPQDESFLEGHQKAAYALDEHGKYAVVPSRGWEPERIATSVALEAQDRTLRTAWEDVGARRRSPLAYHMTRRQLTPGLLASNVGVSSWRVRWHLRPAGFRMMSLGMALKYAAYLEVPIERFVTVPPQPETLMEPSPNG